MRPEIKAKLAALPAAPGVYLMRDARGTVFYVGKAKSLRDRVRSYFSGFDTRAFVAMLDELLYDIEVVLTNSEKEALLVENDIIKHQRPRFNVELKDDKRFLCLRLDTRVKYPKLEVVRRFSKDGARYFGPYTSAVAIRATLRIINQHFQLRTCSDNAFASRRRPCLQYQIKRCPAPCVFDLSHGEYQQHVDNVIKFLCGEGQQLTAILQERMQDAALKQDYEAAALLRDQIRAIKQSLERQNVVASDFISRDIVGLYREGPAVEIHIMRVRDGRLIDAMRFSFDDLEIPTSELLSDFAVRYYTNTSDIPDEILFPKEMEWTSALADVLADKCGRRIEVLTPQKGNKHTLVELAVKNAQQAFRDKQREQGAAQTATHRLQRALHLSRPPINIECFDISHLSGSGIVASCVRLVNGVAQKNLYRHYKIRSLTTADDFQALYEVLSRRARRGLEEGDLPDLIVIDGGKGQLNSARAALSDYGIDHIEIVGLAKAKIDSATEHNHKLQTRRRGRATSTLTDTPDRIFVLGQKKPIILGENSAELFLLTRARDEAHRFAITFQRKQRKQSISRSILDNIAQIGPKRRQSLLRTFGSLAQIRKANAEDITKVIGPKAAQILLDTLLKKNIQS
ncbi:MAG: excinuclease ABC subunit UvrC [Deltaproteobacteria bacterium]|nr:excinuclease ABC subunit UvrC [Deltaproteobacteria bacterium]